MTPSFSLLRTVPMLAAGLACSLAAAPRTLITAPENLVRSRELLAAGDERLRPALEALLAEADQALKQKPVSVVDDELVPPSGDRRDYMSVGPYWWPNPKTENGLPYVRRDGEVNPERNEGDSVALGRMNRAVQALCLGYFFTGREEYAEHAARLLRAWFLDPETGMKPNLNYGQAIPGITEGRGIGIIDTASLASLVDVVGLLDPSPAWTQADRQGLEQWFGAYLDWLLTSKHGRDEARAHNNHGTWYDVQVVAFALFCGREDVARKTLAEVGSKRLAKQIEPDGRQPHELARTKTWSYSIMNLHGFLTLARLGRHAEVDLWNFATEDGRSLRRALDFLAEYGKPGATWPHAQLGGWQFHALLPCLLVGADGFAEPAYRELLACLPEDGVRKDRSQLFHPPAP